MRTAKLPSKRSRRSGSSVWRPDLRARWRAGAFRGRTARPDRGSHVWREHGYGRERICKSDYRGSRIVGLPLRSRRQIHRREDWRRVRVPRHQRKDVVSVSASALVKVKRGSCFEKATAAYWLTYARKLLRTSALSFHSKTRMRRNRYVIVARFQV
ncbi:hypothetical protein PV04_06736 [Phialophora macrospora]|uniref:Uncharacterized protein n=1 Tax=Phialophora macrospora TaxID=1851006 RepID=A0A0D2CQU0_9EURO|nr:hypothetical protein PV04_06736 [Phialophora macrospora]